MSKSTYSSKLETIFSQAVKIQQSGDHESAACMYDQILQDLPESPLVNYNKGLALYELKRFVEACVCFEIALISVPDEPDILYNLALCKKQLGLYQESITAYKRVLKTHPEDIDSLFNLGCCYKDMLDDVNAVLYYQKVLEIDKNHAPTLSNIAFSYHRKGDFGLAEKYFSRLLEINPDHTSASHMLASLKGLTTASPPEEYIEQVFDSCSERFDECLVNDLEYAVPQQMREYFSKIILQSAPGFTALDLGCGTGLAAQSFSDICENIDGVDLSANMLQVASSKNIYSHLSKSNISDYLRQCSKKYDLILSSDVFTYLGELENIFILLNGVALAGGFFCFSTEKDNHSMYSLKKSGRYAHSLSYIKNICRVTGWDILEYQSIKKRKDRDNWIEGILYFTQKMKNT